MNDQQAWGTQFRQRVLAVVRGIPAGQTKTYGQVAGAAGRPRAARAVGNLLRHIWQTDRGRTVPCHRVIRANGTAGGYAGGVTAKLRKLRAEGVDCKHG